MLRSPCLKLFVIAFLAVCFLNISDNANGQFPPGGGGRGPIKHGQWITDINVYEHATNIDLVTIGGLEFHRGNALIENWESYALAYPRFVLIEPYFKYDKFPKLLSAKFETGVSKFHPVKDINKSRVGVVKFYFKPAVDDRFFGDPKLNLPTDVFDMTFSSKKASVELARNLSDRVQPDSVKGFTVYSVQVRVDAQNNKSRADLIDFNHKYRLAIYAKDPKGKWDGPEIYNIPPNALMYGTVQLLLPVEYAVAGKYTIKGVIEVNSFTVIPPPLPGSPGIYSGWTKLNSSDDFIQELDVDEGVSR